MFTIQPMLGDIGTSDFFRASEAVRIGLKKAVSMSSQMEKLAAGEESYKSYLSCQRRKPFEEPKIDYIQIVGDSPLSEKVIESQIRTKHGEKLDMEILKKDITRLYGLDLFESTAFRLEKKMKKPA